MSEDERISVRSLHEWWTPDGYEIVEIVPLYWSSWDGDTHAVIVRNLEDGTTKLTRLQATDMPPGGKDTAAILRRQVETLRTAIADTEAFLAMVAEVKP